MAGRNNNLRGDQASIKYRWDPVVQSSSELGGFAHEECGTPLSNNFDKKCGKRSDPKTHEILSTAELISAVGQVWDYACRPLASLRNEVNSSHDGGGSKNDVILRNIVGESNDMVPHSSPRTNYFCVDLRTAGHESPSKTQPNLDFMGVAQKISVSEPFGERYRHSSIWRLLQGGEKMIREPWRQQGLASVEISCELKNAYGWMKHTTFVGSKHQIKGSEVENRNSEYCIPVDTISIAGDTTSPANNLAASNYSLIKSVNLHSLSDANLEMNTRSSLCTDYLLRASPEADSSISLSSFSNLYADYNMNSLVSCNSGPEECWHSTDDNQLRDTKSKQPEKWVSEDSFKEEVVSSSASRKSHFTLAKQEHAFAGAFAGIFVTLCLHPVDTIKTVVQSCRAEQKSLFYIGRSIVSDRGLTGLYRGITTNIASSAPISAIYTFTYESIKGALLPIFPKEYYSFAHCVAGGCASVATSFVFTPSEHIKQQMQVGSHYGNCWKALVGIIRKGGLRSLYAGWGAVLCRNVPHSIIKFYTYESLKQLMSSSLPSSIQPNTLQTLVCGGLAGSTAALFTTPFDVVKTRLQTQIPGSTSQYSSVVHALCEIGKNEGVKGLYRGLTPRLVMYLSQGALFFASYETFKRLMALETPQPEAERIQHQDDTQDDSLIPSPSSAPTKLHNLH
ncbi:calcium-binding mitochondrial carrier protein Aralar1 isoform X1 [Morus notabilis]|uniref:calcium-binding mitochondrial carrier protein Aralar1 isoform X1 n=1 Tax=Morus notabilis TaxID=981085 RepID=UPI000CED1A59|nr:calcium-binding mitochondrial carrier protein Aralar1 isoform X1 [Morus notabilis]XP_024031497.1 calcium-binding mitochondrial carrier protein Aralar1 isoform X1 [Morus notabilis]